MEHTAIRAIDSRRTRKPETVGATTIARNRRQQIGRATIDHRVSARQRTVDRVGPGGLGSRSPIRVRHDRRGRANGQSGPGARRLRARGATSHGARSRQARRASGPGDQSQETQRSSARGRPSRSLAQSVVNRPETSDLGRRIRSVATTGRRDRRQRAARNAGGPSPPAGPVIGRGSRGRQPIVPTSRGGQSPLVTEATNPGSPSRRAGLATGLGTPSHRAIVARNPGARSPRATVARNPGGPSRPVGKETGRGGPSPTRLAPNPGDQNQKGKAATGRGVRSRRGNRTGPVTIGTVMAHPTIACRVRNADAKAGRAW